MNATKVITMLVAALVVSAGAGAVTAAQADTDTDADTAATVDASYDNGTVTVSVTQNGTAVENVSVEDDGESVGTTDANGSLTFDTNATEELELAFEGENIDLERTYAIEDGDLVVADEEEPSLAADVSYDNGTVDVTVTQNDSGVENATVVANGETVGMTDADGTLTFQTNATEELELEITAGEQELERSYTIEDGELVADEEESDEDAGPNENASDRAHSVFAVIQSWMSSDDDSGQNLGQMIQDAVANGNDDAPGNSGDAPGQSDKAPGNDSDDGAENETADDAPGKSDKAPGQAPDGDDADDAETEDEEDEEEDDDDETRGNGNGNNGNGNGNN